MVLRILIALFLSFLFLNVSAQVQLAVFAGPQATSARYFVQESKQPTAYKYGAMAGVGLKVPFDNQLYFFPSLYYSKKGYKVTLNKPSFPPTELARNNNTSIHTLEIAPLFQVDFSRSASHLFMRFGPTVDFAFSGRETFDTASNGAAVERAMVFSFGDYGRISASANVHLGFETNRGLMIFAHYAHGIGSMNNADNGPRILHRIFGLSVGWLFGHNPNVIDTRVRE